VDCELVSRREAMHAHGTSLSATRVHPKDCGGVRMDCELVSSGWASWSGVKIEDHAGRGGAEPGAGERRKKGMVGASSAGWEQRGRLWAAGLGACGWERACWGLFGRAGWGAESHCSLCGPFVWGVR